MTVDVGGSDARLDLYWIPLGAGARVVQTSGRIYEGLAALAQRRPRQDLYHSALVADTAEGRYVVEMTPVPDDNGSERGVVGGGAVGSRLLGRLRVFRYELRRWRDGVVPDIAYAVDSPVRITNDVDEVRRALALLELVPTPVWGRDELGAGEMWNSNSVTSWVLERAGLVDAAGVPPRGGRAPGWDAGVLVARRSLVATTASASRPDPSRQDVRLPTGGARVTPPRR